MITRDYKKICKCNRAANNIPHKEGVLLDRNGQNNVVCDCEPCQAVNEMFIWQRIKFLLLLGMLVEPVHNSLGCSETTYTAPPSDADWIALVERGNCTFGTKAYSALNHGAKAILVYMHNEEPPDTLMSEIPGKFTLDISTLHNFLMKLLFLGGILFLVSIQRPSYLKIKHFSTILYIMNCRNSFSWIRSTIFRRSVLCTLFHCHYRLHELKKIRIRWIWVFSRKIFLKFA